MIRFLKISQIVVSMSKQTLKTAIPLIGTRILRACSGFISMAMMAQLGHSAVAGGALIVGTSTTVMFVSSSLFYSIAVIIGRLIGKAKNNEIGPVMHGSLLLSFVIGIISSLVIWNANYILLFFHQQPTLVALTTEYFHAFSFGILPSLWIVCFDEFFIGILQSRMVIYWSSISAILNTGLSYVLLFGEFGFPNLGIAGVGYASTIVSWVMFVVLAFFLYARKEYKIYKLFRFRNLMHTSKVFKIGWPISLQLGSISASYSVLTYMIGWNGELSLAAHQIANQFDNLVIMIPYGMAQATAVLISQVRNLHKESIDRLWKVGIFLVGIGVLFFSIFYWLTPDLLVSIYLNSHNLYNQATINLTIILLAIVGVTQLIDSIGIIISGALRGLHDTKVPMFINLLITWLLIIPLGYILSFTLKIGVSGLYLSFCFGALVSSFFLYKRLQSVVLAICN